MSSSMSVLLIGALLLAAVSFFMLILQRSKVTNLADQVNALEGQLRARDAQISGVQEELNRARKEVRVVQAPAPKLVAPPKVEQAEKREKPAKKQEKESKEQGRIRELEDQLAAALRRNDKLDALVKTRDKDVAELREQMESLHVNLANLQDAQKSRPAPVEVAPVEPETKEAAPAAPAPDVEQLQRKIESLSAELATAQKDFNDVNTARLAAVERLNLNDNNQGRLQARVESLHSRSRELVERMAKAERDAKVWGTQYEHYRQMYLMMKARFELACDLLESFRVKFGVTVPTELGVTVGDRMEDHLELDEEEERPRPRPRRPSRNEGGRLAAGATATDPNSVPNTILPGEPNPSAPAEASEAPSA